MLLKPKDLTDTISRHAMSFLNLMSISCFALASYIFRLAVIVLSQLSFRCFFWIFFSSWEIIFPLLHIA